MKIERCEEVASQYYESTIAGFVYFNFAFKIIVHCVKASGVRLGRKKAERITRLPVRLTNVCTYSHIHTRILCSTYYIPEVCKKVSLTDVRRDVLAFTSRTYAFSHPSSYIVHYLVDTTYMYVDQIEAQKYTKDIPTSRYEQSLDTI